MKDTFLTRALLCLAFLFSNCLASDDGNLEYKVKAGYLYNFTKFVTWPHIKSTSFNLCLLGNDPFGAVIDPIEDKSAFDLPIKVLRLREADFLSASLKADCHIIYVSATNGLKIIFEKIQSSPYKRKTLVVGESEAFTAQGGMIGFVKRDSRIKLQINLQAAKQTDLKISAKLLEVAELIKEKSHD
jgi:YfiR/HmsC-like